MPTPVVHLCVSKKILKKINIYNVSGFYLASIIPDSMLIAPEYHDIDGKDEEHSAAHFINPDARLWKKAVIDFIKRNKSGDERDFFTGYGVHVLTDIHWKETFLPEIERRYVNDHGDSAGFKDAYYSDMKQLDFDLYEKHELKKYVWGYLADCPVRGIDGLIKTSDANAWKQNTIHLFDNKKNRHKPTDYFSFADVSDFIQSAADTVAAELKKSVP